MTDDLSFSWSVAAKRATMAASDRSAALQSIRDRAGIVAKLGPPRPGDDLAGAAHRSAADVPRLLKAVEAALKLPAEWRHESEALRDAAGKVWEGAPDAAGVRLKHAYAAGYAECAKALEAAITSALSGEGAD